MLLSRLRAFTRPARLFILAMVIFAFGISGPTTLMNLYLDAAGLDRVYIGWWHSASQFGGVALMLPAMLSFRWMGRRQALWFGAFISILVRAFTVLSLNPLVIVAAEALSGFGTVVFGLASVSFLADASTETDRAAVFSANDFLRTAGLLMGGVLAGWLPSLIAPALADPNNLAASYRVVIIGSYAVRLLGVIPLWLIARSSDLALSPSPQSSGKDDTFNVLRLINPRYLLRQPLATYLWAVPYMLIWVADSLIFPFFSLYLRDVFGMSSGVYGVVSSLRGLVGALALLTPPYLMARFHAPRILTFSILGMALLLMMLGISSNVWLTVTLSIFYVAILAAAMMTYRVFVINQTARPRYLLVSSVLGVTMNAGPAIAPPISGYLQRQFGFAPVITLSALLMALALVALLATLKTTTRLARQQV